MLRKQALEILRNHKREQDELVNSVGQDWTDLDLVFPSGVGTPLTAINIHSGISDVKPWDSGFDRFQTAWTLQT